MKKFLIIMTLTAVMFAGRVKADEGMWLLPFIKELNIKDMKKKGFKLSAEDIYSANKKCLANAIVIFGNGCTGEIISDKGLILTNHHCGYSSIQQHSTVENDYLKNGFWAMSMEEEIPTPGLQVRFVREITDVTDKVLDDVTDNMSEKERNEIIAENTVEIGEEKSKENKKYEVIIKSFFGGNQYIMFAYEVFNDVRMVGAPPTSIGKFGGETDNWMWPRHTGDFSLFRVYSSPDGSPAEYSKDNVPYKPANHLSISLKGYKPGDFAMIMGFPGSTERYMSSFEIEKMLTQENPDRIEIRGLRQGLLMEDMKASDKIRIQYAAKYAQSSNFWKNSIGMSRGLKKLKVKDKKEAIERDFAQWANQTPERKAKYGNALQLIETAVDGMKPYEKVTLCLKEALVSGSEILMMSAMGSQTINQMNEGIKNGDKEAKAKAIKVTKEMYKDYNESTDRKVAKAMFKIVREKLDAKDLPLLYTEVIDAKFGGNIDAYVDNMYDKSIFASQQSLENFISASDSEKVATDPAFVALKSVSQKMSEANGKLKQYHEKFVVGHRLFVDGYTQMDSKKKHYPDANFTLRMTYGQVLPYEPEDGVTYNHFTTLKGVIEKEDPTNPMEFTVDQKMKDLYKNKDFGRYANKQGQMPVAFLSNNDITGGNSGSPVLNGRGELIGLAFDGNWEAMSGDVAFEPELQRTISVDIRYVLFVMDKFAGAQRLIDELTIVK